MTTTEIDVDAERNERRKVLTTIAAVGISPIATDDNLIELLDEVLRAICLELIETSIHAAEDAQRLAGVRAFFGALVGVGEPPEPGDGNKWAGIFHVGRRIQEQLGLPTVDDEEALS